MTNQKFCEWVRLCADATSSQADVYQRLIEATDRLVDVDDKYRALLAECENQRRSLLTTIRR
jgi:hypothetical protein